MTRSGGRARGATAALACILTAIVARAAEPVTVRGVEILRPDATARPVFEPEAIRRWLEPVLADGCDPDAAHDALDRRYRFLGYVPAIEARCDAGALDLTIRESSHRITLIAFDPAELVRRGLKADPWFEDRLHLHPVPADGPRAALRALLQTREGDLYNHERYRAERQAIERLGYTLAFVPLPPGDEPYPPGAYLIQGLAPPAPAGRTAARRRNYVGGDASFGPRRGGSIGAQYQRQELFGRLDRLSVAPLYNAALGGQLTYVAPFLADRDDPHRLYDLTLEFYSDFIHDRFLEGIETDQRTSGASFGLGIRPARLAPRHDLRFEFGVRHERLDLERAIPGEPEEDLSAVRLGVNWSYRHTDRWPSLTMRLYPSVDLAVDGAGGARAFVRPGLEAGLHTRHLSGWETDLRVIGGTVDRQVPSFEQWSLGGAASVRGFREDFRLGRHLGALQAEIWFPLARTLQSRPDPGGATDLPLEPRSARLLKGALIFDGGAITGTADGDNVAIAGAGIGLRFLVPRRPVVVKIDYVWGLGGRGEEAFPYASLGYRF